MSGITVIIPAQNEEKNIGECIKTVLWADEILVADAFSKDRTVAIAKSFEKVRVIQREYGYSTSQKNWAIPQASNDWIFILDADERVPSALAEEIISAVSLEAPGIDAYSIGRRGYFLGRRIRFSGWQNDRVTRLFRKGRARYEDKLVHGKLLVDGAVAAMDNMIDHYSIDSVSSYIIKMDKYSSWGAAEKHRKGKKAGPFMVFFRVPYLFVKKYFLRLGFLDGMPGLVLCMLTSCTEALRMAKLWEMGMLKPDDL